MKGAAASSERRVRRRQWLYMRRRRCAPAASTARGRASCLPARLMARFTGLSLTTQAHTAARRSTSTQARGGHVQVRCAALAGATPGPGRTLAGNGFTAICPEQLPVRALRRTGLVARHKHGHARHSVVCACVAQLVAEARVIATNSPAIDLSACCGVQNLPTRHRCLAHQ